MTYDNLHTTVEILEAFQGCRDAGEEIDLFEALAWRDEPPIAEGASRAIDAALQKFEGF